MHARATNFDHMLPIRRVCLLFRDTILSHWAEALSRAEFLHFIRCP